MPEVHFSDICYTLAVVKFKQLKKTVYILLLILVLLQAGGLLFVYRIGQIWVKYQMQLSLKSNNKHLEKLIFTIYEYEENIFDEHEMIYHGKLYDVKSVNISGDKVELIAIHDFKEEGILKKMNDLATNTNRSKAAHPNKLKTFVSLNYLLPDAGLKNFIPVVQIADLNTYNLLLDLIDDDIPTPPPKLV